MTIRCALRVACLKSVLELLLDDATTGGACILLSRCLNTTVCPCHPEGDFSFLRVLIKIAISFLEQAFVPIEQLNDSLEEVMSPLNGGMVWSIYPVVLGEDTRNRQDRLQ